MILNGSGANNATAESGVMYIEGAMRGVPSRTFTVPMTGTVTVGVYLIYGLVTPTEDPDILDPAVGLQNYSEPGAYRLSKTPQWGYDGQPSPPGSSAFFPVYEVVDGVIQPKDSPPDINAISMAIARYDVQSTGSHYVANGMAVKQMADDAGQQVFLIDAGTARIGGKEVTAALYAASWAVVSTAAAMARISSTVVAERNTGTCENRWALGRMNVSKNAGSPASCSSASRSDGRSSVTQKQFLLSRSVRS